MIVSYEGVDFSKILTRFDVQTQVVETPEQAAELLSSGASLIQLHTGLLYRGPKLVKKIKQYLVKH